MGPIHSATCSSVAPMLRALAAAASAAAAYSSFIFSVALAFAGSLIHSEAGLAMNQGLTLHAYRVGGVKWGFGFARVNRRSRM